MMTLQRGAVSRFARLAVLCVLLGGLIAGAGRAALAECLGPPWPSFREAVPTAKTVFVGTVAKTLPRDRSSSNWFVLRVDEVLRGKVPAVIEFSALESGTPSTPCDPLFLQVGGVGERLALAMDARLEGVPGRVNAAAVVGDRVAEPQTPGVEALTPRKVRRLAGREPDGSTSSTPRGPADGPMSRAVVKRVAAGVWRVTDDWTGSDMRRLRFIAAGPDDAIWLAGAHRLSRLGQAGAISKPERMRYVFDLDITPDGNLLVDGAEFASFDGQSWTRYWSAAGGSREHRYGPLLATDGTLWAGTANEGYARLDGEGWTGHGHACYCDTSGFAETPDGIWMGVAGAGGFEGFSGTGLFRLDGERWDEIRPIAGQCNEVHQLVAGTDGTLWVSLLPEDADGSGQPDYERAYLARWDGTAWTVFWWPSWLQPKLAELPLNAGTDGFRSKLSDGIEVAPDGTLWFQKPLMSFDGETWTKYEIPHRKDDIRPRVSDFTVASDGKVWLVVRDYTRWHPGEGDGIYVIDPAKAASAKGEDATTDPTESPTPAVAANGHP